MAMAKTRTVLKVTEGGKKFSVVYHDGDNNPYWVYRHTWALRECGYGMSERKRIEIKYADFKSCMFYLSQQW